MDLANLKKYIPSIDADGQPWLLECKGGYVVKFEDVKELLKQADNSVNRKLPTWDEFQEWCFNRDGGRDARSLFHFFTGNYPA